MQSFIPFTVISHHHPLSLDAFSQLHPTASQSLRVDEGSYAQAHDSVTMDVDPSPCSTTDRQASSQASSLRLFRASQLLPPVLEQFIESFTQSAESLLPEDDNGKTEWASGAVAKQIRMHQKMAFHAAVYLKVRMIESRMLFFCIEHVFI